MLRHTRSTLGARVDPLLNSILWTLVARFVPAAVQFDERDPLLVGSRRGDGVR